MQYDKMSGTTVAEPMSAQSIAATQPSADRQPITTTHLGATTLPSSKTQLSMTNELNAKEQRQPQHDGYGISPDGEWRKHFSAWYSKSIENWPSTSGTVIIIPDARVHYMQFLVYMNSNCADRMYLLIIPP